MIIVFYSFRRKINIIGESEKNNDLFYTCSLIEYTARCTKNTKKYIVEKLGRDKISKIYDLASVYHCENIGKLRMNLF